jgi:hypothetical protein
VDDGRTKRNIRTPEDLSAYPAMSLAIDTLYPEIYDPVAFANISILTGTNVLVDEWNDAVSTKNPAEEVTLRSIDVFADVEDEHGHLKGDSMTNQPFCILFIQ